VTPPEPQRGELWWVDWAPGRGSEQTGYRPAIVVQTDAANLNPRYPNTIVVTVSTRGRDVPTHVRIEPTPANGLRQTSFAKCEQLLTVSKDRLTTCLGRLTPAEMQQVASALHLVLDL
jgi:mRNA interferase MazF